MTPLKTYTIHDGTTYCVHPQHRDKTHGKSQWTISMNEERDVFLGTLTQSWVAQDAGWGLRVDDGRITYLGVARDHVRQVFIAKFVHTNHRHTWHGYPADHQSCVKDIPDESILRSWLDTRLLSPAKICKLQKGKPCSL
jgi:hypothetical protein